MRKKAITLCAECATTLGYKGRPDREKRPCIFCGRQTFGYIYQPRRGRRSGQ